MKIVFRTMSLIVFVGFLSCEKDQDEIIPTEISEVPTALAPTATENITKELHDPYTKSVVLGPESRESDIITGTINRTTGEYRDVPGKRIKVDYFASPGAPCYEDEELEIRIIGNGVYVYVDLDFGGRTAASKRGSRIFIMPASGVVKIRAAIKANNGCSRANIKFNNANKIELGTGGYGERKFP